MRLTRLGLVAGTVVFAFLCWLAIIGVTAAAALVVTTVLLVVLVAGGNWLGGRNDRRPARRPAPPTPPVPATPETAATPEAPVTPETTAGAQVDEPLAHQAPPPELAGHAAPPAPHEQEQREQEQEPR